MANIPKTSIRSVKRSLENRLIFCADCDTNQILTVSSSGNLVCSSCGSENWMHVPLMTKLKESIFFKGELRVHEDLLIDGQVEGKIELSEHHLMIGPNARINAEIHAKNVTITGSVMGKIFAGQAVQIKSPGFVKGDIECARISIADGAYFNGRISTDRSSEKPSGFDPRHGDPNANSSHHPPLAKSRVA